MKRMVHRYLRRAFSLRPLPQAAAADPVADFYKGKSVTLVVGHETGTGFDIYTRVLQRHLSRHIAGNPTIIAIRN